MPNLIFRLYDVVQTGYSQGQPLWGVDESLPRKPCEECADNDGACVHCGAHLGHCDCHLPQTTQRLLAGRPYVEAQAFAGMCEMLILRFIVDNELEVRLQAGDEAIAKCAALENEVLDLRSQLAAWEHQP